MTDTRALVEGFDDELLESSLRDLIADDLTLVSRRRGEYESTHPIDEVTVATEGGFLELVCKYSQPHRDRFTGHDRGARYEAAIYERVFPDPDLETPECFGSFRVDGTVDCLVLENVVGYRIHHSIYPRGLVTLSADLARFHLRGVRGLHAGFNMYNRAYFSKLVSEIEPLPGVASRLKGAGSIVIDALSNAPRTVIHGELYPENVMIDETGPVVIDWEAAGLGPGLLDFAVLTQGSWEPDLIDECEEVYLGEGRRGASHWGERLLAASRIAASGQLLLHLRGKDTDGVQSEIALETIGSQAPLLRL